MVTAYNPYLIQFVTKKYSATKSKITLLNFTVKSKSLQNTDFSEYLPYLWSYTHFSRGILFCDKL